MEPVNNDRGTKNEDQLYNDLEEITINNINYLEVCTNQKRSALETSKIWNFSKVSRFFKRNAIFLIIIAALLVSTIILAILLLTKSSI